jgi:hypothetical protein
MKFRILMKRSEGPKTRHRQKYRSHDFEPQLMCDAAKRSEHRANRPFRRADRAISSCLFARYSRHDPDFSPARNIAHALDFSSLQRYNDRTAIEWRPFLASGHLSIWGD